MLVNALAVAEGKEVVEENGEKDCGDSREEDGATGEAVIRADIS